MCACANPQPKPQIAAPVTTGQQPVAPDDDAASSTRLLITNHPMKKGAGACLDLFCGQWQKQFAPVVQGLFVWSQSSTHKPSVQRPQQKDSQCAVE